MTEPIFTSDFCSKTVVGFCQLDAHGLTALKNQLELSINLAGLSFCQNQFKRLFRDPTVGELSFLSALTARLHELPPYMSLDALHFDVQADARIWQDVCKKREVLLKNAPPTLLDVMNTSALYLARAGCTPRTELYATHPADPAFVKARDAGALTLALDGAAAALKKPCCALPTPHPGQVLLALTADMDVPLDITVERFMHTFEALTPVPIATVGDEGLGVHLAGLPFGAEIDTLCLPTLTPEGGAAALVDACRDTVIFAVAPTKVGTILESGAPAKPIGKLLPNDQVLVRDGMHLMLSLPRTLLRAWRSIHTVSLTLPQYDLKPHTPNGVLCANETHVLSGTRISENALPHLMELLQKAHAGGARFETASLAVALSLPRARSLAPHSLSLLLALHRFTCEMALPTADCRLMIAPPSTPPTLSVFLAATRGDAPNSDQAECLSKALEAGDFAKVRSVIYQKGV